MKRILFLIAAAAMLCGCSNAGDNAQVIISEGSPDARELIAQDPSRIGCQIHAYEVPEFVDTKAPKGYKPFYISHFSRHGSRYLTSSASFNSTCAVFQEMSDRGLLTEEGLALKADNDKLAALHKGMYGYLSQVGAREHQGVASRMYERCPGIFKDKSRNEVLAVASTTNRCGMSMTNFCTALKGCAPGLDISYNSDDNTNSSVTKVASGKRRDIYPPEDNGSHAFDSLNKVWLSFPQARKRLFTDAGEAGKLAADGDLNGFLRAVIYNGTSAGCIDGEDIPSIFHYFSADELYGYWRTQNAQCLNSHGYSIENGEARRRCGQYILRDMIEKADAAMEEGSRKAADFRFGHDSGVLPLIFFLGLKNNGHAYEMGKEADEGWYAWENICMCSNVQMIFYRSRRSGEILVKFLHNERETTISALDPDYGPYYKWSVLRPYLETLCDADCG